MESVTFGCGRHGSYNPGAPDRACVAYCFDCDFGLAKGEGQRQKRYGRLRLVCRDRTGCAARRAYYDVDYGGVDYGSEVNRW